MTATYEDRLRRVAQYIHDNPAGDLSLDRLADVAAMSRFHWHRVYHAMTGETCAQTVRRIRMFRAGVWLLETDWPVDQIMARCGYANPQSFSRAFRATYGQTPQTYRTNGVSGALALPPKEGEFTMFPVEIRDLPAARLVGMRHTGPYNQIGQAFDQVSAIISARGLWPQTLGMAGVYFDDPSAIPETELRSFGGVFLGPEVDLPDGLMAHDLPAGRHAVLTFTGPYTGLKAAYDFLYGDWLPNSGEEPADAASFEVYVNSPMHTAPQDLKTEICAPLRG